MQLFIISLISNIDEINVMLIIHLILLGILMFSLRFGSPYYNMTIETIEFIGVLIHFFFVILTLGIINLTD
jgi:hypothetical protein